MMLTGFREHDHSLLSGYWLPGELLGLPLDDRPPLAGPVTTDPPAVSGDELLVLPGTGFIRFTKVDWVSRHARLEIGLQCPPPDPRPLLTTALAHCFQIMSLHRVYGWVTPAVYPGTTAALTAVGLEREAVIPRAVWHDGRLLDREIWSALDD